MRSVLILRVIQIVALAVTFTAILSGVRPSMAVDDACESSRSPTPVGYTAFFGRQHGLAASSAEWSVRLVAWQPSTWPPRQFTFEAKNRKAAIAKRLAFGAWGSLDSLQVNQIDEIHTFRDKLLIIGRAGANSSEADIVDLKSGKILDRFSCFMPAVSPDSSFVAFLKSFPGHPGAVSVNAQYRVYSLLDDPANHRPPLRAVYPPDATTAPGGNLTPGMDSPAHWISSGRLFWIDASTVAFTDHYPGQDELVLVNLSDSHKEPVLHTQKLPVGELVDLQRCQSRYSAAELKNIALDLAGMIRVKEIDAMPGKPGSICLRLDANPCLTRTELILEAPFPQGFITPPSH